MFATAMRTEPGASFFLVGQVNLVVADMLGTQQFRGFFEMACEQGETCCR